MGGEAAGKPKKRPRSRSEVNNVRELKQCELCEDIDVWLNVRGSKKESDTENKRAIEVRSLESYARGI